MPSARTFGGSRVGMKQGEDHPGQRSVQAAGEDRALCMSASTRALARPAVAAGEAAALDRPVPEHVTQAIAEELVDLGDEIVRRPAVRARVAAVLDERDLGAGGAEDVIVRPDHPPVQPVGPGYLRHARAVEVSAVVRLPSALNRDTANRYGHRQATICR